MNIADQKALVAQITEAGEQGNPLAATWAIAFQMGGEDKREELCEALVNDLRKVFKVATDMHRTLMAALPPSARAVLEAPEEDA